MSLLEHWDSDSMPVPILCHTIRWEREAARGRAGGSSACCDTQLPHSQVKRPDKHHRTVVQTEQTAQPSTMVPPCPPSSQHWDSWEMCWSQGQHGHGCQVMDKCTTPLVSPGCGSTHVPVVVGTARPGRGSSSCPSLPPKSLLSSLLPAPKQCLTPTATSSSQHGMGEGQPEAGHPHPKALKLATPVTPLHPKPAMSAPSTIAWHLQGGLLAPTQVKQHHTQHPKSPHITPREQGRVCLCSSREDGAAAYSLPASLPIPVLPTVPIGTGNRCWPAGTLRDGALSSCRIQLFQ